MPTSGKRLKRSWPATSLRRSASNTRPREITICKRETAHHPRSIIFPSRSSLLPLNRKNERGSRKKLGASLHKLTLEDPSFKMRTDEETSQTIISGMGELHLEIIVDRVLREFGVESHVGQPQVAYRETITKTIKKRRPFYPPVGGQRPVRAMSG